MSKEWTMISCSADGDKSTKAERVKKARVFDKMMRSSKTSSYVELKKEGDNYFATKSANEDSLIAAYNDKKLKSKSLIHKAENIIAKRKRRERKKNGGRN